MLILTRKPGESLYIGDDVKITIVEIKGNQIRVGIEAPDNLRIYRQEIYVQILEENRKAAEEAAAVSATGLEGLSDVWRERKRGDDASRSSEDPGKPAFSSVAKGTVQSAGLKAGAKLRPRRDEDTEPGDGRRTDPQVHFKRRRLKDSDSDE